jgi:hypothetical protein
MKAPTANHKHRTEFIIDRGWSGCVVATLHDSAAHGATTAEEHCRCGARRVSERNQGYRSSTGWIAYKEAQNAEV